LKRDVSRLFFEAVLGQARQLHLLSNQLWADLATAAYNLVRLGNLVAEAA
jgi:hypothetical protein